MLLLCTDVQLSFEALYISLHLLKLSTLLSCSSTFYLRVVIKHLGARMGTDLGFIDATESIRRYVLRTRTVSQDKMDLAKKQFKHLAVWRNARI